MAYKIQTTNSFERCVKRCMKRNYPMEKLWEAMHLLEESGKLPASFKPHKLTGNFADNWECHLAPDWLLVWKQNDKELVLIMLLTGTHSDIF